MMLLFSDLVTSTTQQMERTTTSMDTLNKTVTEGERDNTTELESDGTTTLNSPHLSTQDTTHQATDRVSSQHSAATVIAIIISTALTLSLVTLFVAIMAALAKQRRQKVHENRQNVLNLRPSDGQEEEQSGNEENCSSLCLDHPENQVCVRVCVACSFRAYSNQACSILLWACTHVRHEYTNSWTVHYTGSRNFQQWSTNKE